jgi:hypothetical protein
MTFANGESHVDIRQYTPRIFANWRKSDGYSPVYLLDIRQLAKVIWMFADIGETPPHSQLLKQRILIYEMDSCEFAEHTASFDPYSSDSTPADSICFVQIFCRLIIACHNTCRSASTPVSL